MEIQFPPVDWADPETGLLCVGGDLSVDTLLAAYRAGIFPWPLGSGEELYWFAPEQRAVLFFDSLHISRNLRKERRRLPYTFEFDVDFPAIIRGCAETRTLAGQRTWITDRLAEAYVELHGAGFVRSVGCYENGELVGGVYGVLVDGTFAGESMFHAKPNASKLSLWVLAERLAEQRIEWMDCQQLTPLLEQFGARLLPRAEFMTLLAAGKLKHQQNLKRPE